MAGTYTTSLKERKAREAETELAIRRALAGRKKALDAARRVKQRKKKSVGELMCMLNLCGIQGKALRPSWEYVPRSHNLERQIDGLLRHMFVQYPAPAFLYRACMKDGVPFPEMQEIFRQWFVTLAQGQSFTKLVKGVMTGREAFVFLSAPAANQVHENVWWARMRVAGIPIPMIDQLIERLFGRYFIDDPGGRLAGVIQFYARYHGDMDKVTFGEITDFLAWKLRNDREFSMKGRTITSVIKLSNEWHVQIQKAKLGKMIQWPGLGIPEWEFVAKERVWTVTELLDNRELLNEGRKQRHCVYSYVQACLSGACSIFSMRAYVKAVKDVTEDGAFIWDRSSELTRVTIQVNSHRMVAQVRGHLNRMPMEDERRILRMWAGEKGFVQCV